MPGEGPRQAVGSIVRASQVDETFVSGEMFCFRHLESTASQASRSEPFAVEA